MVFFDSLQDTLMQSSSSYPRQYIATSETVSDAEDDGGWFTRSEQLGSKDLVLGQVINDGLYEVPKARDGL